MSSIYKRVSLYAVNTEPLLLQTGALYSHSYYKISALDGSRDLTIRWVRAAILVVALVPYHSSALF